MLNVCGHNVKFLFVFSQLFFFSPKKPNSFTALSFLRHLTFHKQGLSHFLWLELWKSLWSLVSLLFPSHTTSSRAYLPINGLFHKYNKYKSHSLHVLQNTSVQQESGSQTIHVNACIFERLAHTTHWWKLYMTVKPPGFCILLSSTISLSILSLYFAGVKSLYSFLTMNHVPDWFYVWKSPWGLRSPAEGGAVFHMTVWEQWNIQLQATGHCSTCAVIFSSGVFQCSGEKSQRGLRFWSLGTSFNIRSRNWNIAQKSDVTWCCHKLHTVHWGLALHRSTGNTVVLGKAVLRNWTVLWDVPRQSHPMVLDH